MSFFNQLGQGQQGFNPMQKLQELRQNPVSVLQQAGYNIPQGMNNPQQIIGHLLQSGQLTNNRLAMLQQMASQMRR